jgi:hypothetical protein
VPNNILGQIDHKGSGDGEINIFLPQKEFEESHCSFSPVVQSVGTPNPASAAPVSFLSTTGLCSYTYNVSNVDKTVKRYHIKVRGNAQQLPLQLTALSLRYGGNKTINMEKIHIGGKNSLFTSPTC